MRTVRKSWVMWGLSVTCMLASCDDESGESNGDSSDELTEGNASDESDGAAAADARAPMSKADASTPMPDAGSPGANGSDASSNSADCAYAGADGTDPLVDDFTTSNYSLPENEGRAGRWFFYDDGSQGRQTAEVEDEALHVESSEWTVWGSGFGVTLSPSSALSYVCAYDVSDYGSLTFRARGQGRVKVRVAMPENIPLADGGQCAEGEACYDWPQTVIDLGLDWASYTLPFCSLQPEGWSPNAPSLDLRHVAGLHFQLQGETDFWLDDVAFSTFTGEDEAGACSGPCPLDAAPRDANLDPNWTWLALNDQLSIHTFEQETPTCGDLTRRYISYVPESLEAASDAPVVIALHGSGANAEAFQDSMARSRWDELAERDGFVVVYGNAAPGRYTSLDLPNSGAWRQDYFDDGQVDDVEYISLVLQDLEQRDVIDGTNDVYLVGISNGGGMTLEAAKRHPDWFVGIAPFMAFDGFNPSEVPSLEGTGLTKVIFGYTHGDPGMPEDYDQILSQLPEQWGIALGLDEAELADPVETALPDLVSEGLDYTGDSAAALATLDSEGTRIDYTDASSEVQLRVLAFDHAGHLWPNPVADTEEWMLALWGFRNQDIDATDEVWDFFMGLLSPRETP